MNNYKLLLENGILMNKGKMLKTNQILAVPYNNFEVNDINEILNIAMDESFCIYDLNDNEIDNIGITLINYYKDKEYCNVYKVYHENFLYFYAKYLNGDIDEEKYITGKKEE